MGEPTRLAVVNAHKGLVRWRLTTYGRAAHSVYPEDGENAVYAMADIIVSLRRYAGQLAGQQPRFGLGSPTLSVDTIRGGTAVNVVPDSCVIGPVVQSLSDRRY